MGVPRRWWTAAELARVCGVNRRTAWRWMKQAATIRCGTTGYWVRITSAELERLVRSNAIPALTAGWMRAVHDR